MIGDRHDTVSPLLQTTYNCVSLKYEHKEKRFVSGEKVELKKVDVVSLSSSEVIGKSRENLMIPLKDD